MGYSGEYLRQGSLLAQRIAEVSSGRDMRVAVSGAWEWK